MERKKLVSKKIILLLLVFLLISIGSYYFINNKYFKLKFSDNELKNITLNINKLNFEEYGEEKIDRNRISGYFNNTIKAFRGNAFIVLDDYNNVLLKNGDSEYTYIHPDLLEQYLIIFNYEKDNNLSVDDINKLLESGNIEKKDSINNYIKWYYKSGPQRYDKYIGYSIDIMQSKPAVYGNSRFYQLLYDEQKQLFIEVNKNFDEGMYDEN